MGKTSLARRIGARLGWAPVSTDTLGQHPGRPWPDIRKPVAEFYRTLSPETIQWFLGVHHRNMWPGLRQRIEAAAAQGDPVLLEGSALRPDLIADDLPQGPAAVFLVAAPDVLRARIHAGSNYNSLPADARHLVDVFLDRSLRDGDAIADRAVARGCQMLNAGDPKAVDRFAQTFATT